ncbi:Pentapeptide repeat-containing protein [Syntrophus gentianae]|uniref:Pentapeptide repeat-containing protein n=1 Tax=Syntrophus gentianae TaxID=43775 RepID=A0A1H8APP8_9BACT|nr:pentapeptide repeat-containing protein [Syntrophus gentianae]SEM71759.1 Pentapeptide repeat-containing protein [Syntrophus gentianae]
MGSNLYDTFLKDVFIKEILINGLIIGVVGTAIFAALKENLNVLRTNLLITSAKRKIRKGHPRAVKRGVNMLAEIAIHMPYRKQEMLDIVTKEVFRNKFSYSGKVPPVTPPAMVEVFVDSLKAILGVPRKDENDHGVNIDLHKIALVAKEGESIYLEKMNFKDVVLWGSEFIRVDFSRSDFENADLGGVRFENCGLEDLNLKNTRMSFSFLEPERPTILSNSIASRSNIDEALIITGDAVQLQIIKTEIDQERREKLLSKKPMVMIE